MKRMTAQAGKDASRYLLIASLTGLLVGCGGSSGDTTGTTDTNDADGDGIPDSEDFDADGDGTDDLDDLFVDLDLDGLDDRDGLTETQALAANIPPIILPIPDDVNRDGFTDASDANPCGDEAGTDNNSSNNTWDDNCTLKRQLNGGQFADSLYTAGMQRVIFCKGFGSGSSVSAFDDGEFGLGTQAALEAYQTSKGLTPDGIVGPQTWAALQADLFLQSPGQFAAGASVAYDGYSVPGDRCGEGILFYQEVTPSGDGLGLDLLGWTLARGPNSDQRVDFSIGSPFNQLD